MLVSYVSHRWRSTSSSSWEISLKNLLYIRRQWTLPTGYLFVFRLLFSTYQGSYSTQIHGHYNKNMTHSLTSWLNLPRYWLYWVCIDFIEWNYWWNVYNGVLIIVYSTESLHKLLFQMLQEEWNVLVWSSCSCKKVNVMTLGSVHQGSFDMTRDTLTFWWQLYWKNFKTQINSCTGFLLDPTFKTVIIASFVT